MRPYQIGINSPFFNLKSLQRDINCVAIQDPSQVWGVQDFLPRRNLLTYTEDFSNAAWSLTQMLAFGGGSTANATTAPDGATTADLIVESTASNVNHTLQTVTPYGSAGVAYTLSVFVKQHSSRNVHIYVYDNGVSGFKGQVVYDFTTATVTYGASVDGTNRYGVSAVAYPGGWVRLSVSFVPAGTVYPCIRLANGTGLPSQYTGDGVSGLYVWGAQLTRADTLDQSYQKITDWTTEQYTWAAAKQVPWLRRNACSYTEDMSSWVPANVTVSSNATSAPDGSMTADKVVETNATAVHRLRIATSALTGVCQVYAKAGERDQIWINEGDAAVARFDLTNGAVLAGAGATIESVGSGWYRCTSGVRNFTSSGPYIGIYNGAASYAGDITKGLYLWGAQVCTQACAYQPIFSDWDTTYTAAAIAAGYPISLWQDSAGTKAVNGDNQPIGKMLNYKFNGLYDAIQSTTANQPKWRLDANGKPYIERDGVNDAMPITLPTVLLDEQLGPELVTNGTFTGSATGWALSANVSYSNNAVVFDGGSTSAYARQDGVTTEGKTYRVGFTISSYTSGGLRFMGGSGGSAISMPVASYAAAGDYSFMFTASSTTAGRFWVYSYTTAFNGTVDNISVREVTGTNVVYTAEQNVTLKDSGLILSGSYAPITPAADYGRIIMAGPSKYDAKIIKYLDKKRGRVYSLGPELIPVAADREFSAVTGFWSINGTAAISGGVATITSDGSPSNILALILTAGKTYLMAADFVFTSGSGKFQAGSTSSVEAFSTSGRHQAVLTADLTSFYISRVGACSFTVDNVSVREVLL